MADVSQTPVVAGQPTIVTFDIAINSGQTFPVKFIVPPVANAEGSEGSGTSLTSDQLNNITSNFLPLASKVTAQTLTGQTLYINYGFVSIGGPLSLAASPGDVPGKTSLSVPTTAWVDSNYTPLASYTSLANQVTSLANSSNNNNTTTSATTGSPVGTIISYGFSDIPTGYLLLNGATFSATAYPALYAKLGSTTLPDARGLFLRGLDPNGVADRDGKTRQLLSFQEGTRQFFDHIGASANIYSCNMSDGSVTTAGLGVDPIANQSETHHVVWEGQSTGDYTLTGNANTSGHGAANGQVGQGGSGSWDCITVMRPKNLAVNYLIKAQ